MESQQNAVRSSQEAQYFSVGKTNSLTLLYAGRNQFIFSFLYD
jgi:hypothetical protein